jgi:hypothetical protein
MTQPVIVNTPSDNGGGGYGFLLGVIVLIVFVLVFVFYGIPYVRRTVSPPQINVPDQIDVNVNQGGQ